VILRPVFFIENWLSPWFKPGIDQDKLMVGLRPETVLQMIAVQDIGRYGRLAFEQHQELNGRAIDIAGDQLTMPQTASILSEVMERQITFEPVPLEEVRNFSEDFALMLEWFERSAMMWIFQPWRRSTACARPAFGNGPSNTP
jgi:uncharacterized protein YbjT (DUF2867 family)